MPFGCLAIQTEAVELPLRFPGQYFDQASGGFTTTIGIMIRRRAGTSSLIR